jgi:hypothetical protein
MCLGQQTSVCSLAQVERTLGGGMDSGGEVWVSPCMSSGAEVVNGTSMGFFCRNTSIDPFFGFEASQSSPFFPDISLYHNVVS